MAVTKRVFTNVVAGGYAQAVNVVVQFVTLPLFIKFWGVQGYGEWLVLSAVPSYMALAEAGLGTVASNELAMSAARGDTGAMRKTLQSLWALLLLLCAALFVILTSLSWVIPWTKVFGLVQTSGADASGIVFCLGLYTLMNLLSNAVTAQYRVTDSYARGAVVQATIRLVELGVTVLVLLLGGHMVELAAAWLVVRVVSLIGIHFDARSVELGVSLGLAHATKVEIKRLLKPSLAYMGFPLGNAIYFQGITLAVNAILGAPSVVLFNAVRTLSRVIAQAVTIIKHAAWPEFSSLIGAGDIASARRLARGIWGGAFAFSVVASVGLIIAGPFLLGLWTHGAVTIHRWTLALYLAGVVANTWWSVGSAVLLSTNTHEGLAARYVASSCLGVVAACLLCSWLGDIGAPIAMLIAEITLISSTTQRVCAVLKDDHAHLIKDLLLAKTARQIFFLRIARFYPLKAGLR